MKRPISLAFFLPVILLTVIVFAFIHPSPVLGYAGPQQSPTPPAWVWCCGFAVKSTVPFAWLRQTPSSTAGITAIVFPGQVLTSDLLHPDTFFDGVQWWVYTRGLTFGGWVEVNSLVSAPRPTFPKMTAAAPWSPGARVRVRVGIPFVWLRGFPSSAASPSHFEVKTGGELLVMGNPVNDYRQWWWPVILPSDRTKAGWVEQRSLELASTPPPTPIVIPTPTPASENTQNIPATSQTFENGTMIWRTDTGAVLVLINDGRFMTFGHGVYGNLPDNPVTLLTPAGRIRPIMGFGKVWGNFSAVEFGLGWATAPERSYMMTGFVVSPGNTIVTLLDGRQAVLKPNNQWTLRDGTLPPIGAVSLPGPRQTAVPTPIVIPTPTAVFNTASAAYEPFEGGFMIWRSDNDMIYVMLNTGEVKPGYSAKGLPDNPVTDTPPAGRTKPVSGFGRIWGNYSDVRATLGWALGNEQGYMATITPTQADATNVGPAPSLYFTITLPDGKKVVVAQTAWHFA